MDENNNNQIIPCNKNSLICSTLSMMINDSKEFCEGLGHKINQKMIFDEEMFQNLLQNKTIEPVCYDGKPSSVMFGYAIKNNKDKFAEKLIINAFIAIIFVIQSVLSVN